MRIRHSDNNGTGFGGGWSRSDSFRRKHRVKQKVRGVLLKNVENDMAWVEIDGDRLLAQLETTHPEGARLMFVIEQLTPNIILKELRGGGHGGGKSAIGLANAFDTARALFESKFIPTAAEAHPDTKMTATQFHTLLAGSPELFIRYADAAQCAENLTALLGDENGGRFLYQPWLAPSCRRQVSFVRPSSDSGLTESIVEFDHPDMGLIRAVLLHKGDTTTIRLHLQRMNRAEPLRRFLQSRPDLAGASPTIAKMVQTSHGGIIAEQLFR